MDHQVEIKPTIECPLCSHQAPLSDNFGNMAHCAQCAVKIHQFAFDNLPTISKRIGYYHISLDFNIGALKIIHSAMHGDYKPSLNIMMPDLQRAVDTFTQLNTISDCDDFVYGNKLRSFAF